MNTKTIHKRPDLQSWFQGAEGDTFGKQHTSTRTTETRSGILAVSAPQRALVNNRHCDHSTTIIICLFNLDTPNVFHTARITHRHRHSVRHMVLQTVIRPPSAGHQNLDEQPMEQPRDERVYSMLSGVAVLLVMWLIKSSFGHHLRTKKMQPIRPKGERDQSGCSQGPSAPPHRAFGKRRT